MELSSYKAARLTNSVWITTRTQTSERILDRQKPIRPSQTSTRCCNSEVDRIAAAANSLVFTLFSFRWPLYEASANLGVGGLFPHGLVRLDGCRLDARGWFVDFCLLHLVGTEFGWCRSSTLRHQPFCAVVRYPEVAFSLFHLLAVAISQCPENVC